MTIESIDYGMEKMVKSAKEQLTYAVSSVAGDISEHGEINYQSSEDILDALMTGLQALTSVAETISHLKTYPDSLSRVISLETT